MNQVYCQFYFLLGRINLKQYPKCLFSSKFMSNVYDYGDLVHHGPYYTPFAAGKSTRHHRDVQTRENSAGVIT